MKPSDNIIIALMLLMFPIHALYAQKNDTSNVLELITLSRELQSNNSGEAMKLADKAKEMSHEIKYTAGIIRSDKQIGNLFLEQGKPDQALQQYFKGLKYTDSGRYIDESIDLLNNIGVAYQRKEDLNNALKFHLQALSISEEHNNKKGIAASSNNIGIVQYKSNKIEKALQYFRYSLKIKKELRDTFSIKQTLSNIASVYAEKYDYDSALYFYDYCMHLEQKMGDKRGYGVSSNNIGQIYLMKGEVKKAQPYFYRALAIGRQFNDLRSVSSVFDNLGLSQYYTKNYTKAIQYYDSCLTIALKTGDVENEKNGYLHSSKCYTALKDYKRALVNFKRYEAIANKINDESNNASTSEAIFLKQQKENQILKLEKEQETKKLQISILLSIIGFILLIGIFFYMYYRFRQKSLLQKTLTEKQQLRFNAVMDGQEMERKRIAGDLHDSIGQLLSVIKLNMSDLADTIEINDSDQKKQLSNTLNMVDEACNEVRSISHNIMPPVLIRSGLVSAIRELVKKTNKPGILEMKFTVHDFPERLKENMEIGIYRMIQEMVNNIIKHSKASKAEIILSKEHEELKILIIDNGVGINKKDIENSSGIGWKNIFSRLSALNGTIDIQRGENTGSKFLLVIPV